MARKKAETEAATMPIRIESDAVQAARIAAPMRGQSVQSFASEAIRLHAQEVIAKFSAEQVSKASKAKAKGE